VAVLTIMVLIQKYPMDFMAAVRPETQTTNQALRLMGTYEGDLWLMEKLKLRTMNGVKPGAFHPDVLTAQQRSNSLSKRSRKTCP
jgi:hypothetical protein